MFFKSRKIDDTRVMRLETRVHELEQEVRVLNQHLVRLSNNGKVKRKPRAVTSSASKAPLADAIRKFRIKNGFSQKEAADLAGVAPSTISRIESGTNGKLRNNVLCRLSAAFGINVVELRELDEKQRGALC
jgi:DNA-binding XRE family transcriptional regulator